jgi:hypothetical protein
MKSASSIWPCCTGDCRTAFLHGNLCVWNKYVCFEKPRQKNLLNRVIYLLHRYIGKKLQGSTTYVQNLSSQRKMQVEICCIKMRLLQYM